MPDDKKFEVPIYTDLLDPKRKDVVVPGFSFTPDVFENMIAAFVPRDNIPVALGVDYANIDHFCKQVYGMNYADTYTRLSGIADYWSRNVFKNLAYAGNQSAIKIMAEHFMGLSNDNKNKGVNITIVNDLKGDELDD